MFEDNEVLNGKITYTVIAQKLIKRKSVLIGWSDGRHDHRDILFTYRVKKIGGTRRGLKDSDLYISIIGFNAYGFSMLDPKDNRKANGYIKEKLQLSDNKCDDALCDLINGVIHHLDIEEGKQ